ncbi:MAG: heat-inducible transcription repressor HrcA, partial [candidate division Zixibacteria bacterium]|nr:heat-inducible transcription repressor HrcA [candidate division Zixibacteria bacterium]
MSERERLVLAVLIDHFIRTAEPVGSRTIATRYNLGVSPATVRNTLADLEEQGLIEQPHTSAGRVPTDSGYRLYIDKLLTTRKLSRADQQKIKRELSIDYNAIEEILEQTSRVLARFSSQLGVTVSPKFERSILKKVDLIPVTDTRLLLVITVKSGMVRTLLLEVDSVIAPDVLQETAAVLNEKLGGLSLGKIRRTIGERLRDTGRGNPQLLKLFCENQEGLLDDADDAGLHTDGTTNIVTQREFQDPRKLREFISLIEERKSLIRLLSKESVSEGIQVTIGAEAQLDAMEGCAAVTRSYTVGPIRGTVG